MRAGDPVRIACAQPLTAGAVVWRFGMQLHVTADAAPVKEDEQGHVTLGNTL